MMKRFLCLMLSLMLAVCFVPTSAEEDYTLVEKLQQQIDFGNGIKGALMLQAEGESDWARLLSAINGQEIQLRAIKEQSGDAFQVYLYAEDGEAQVGLTRLYGDGQTLYMSSEVMPALLLSYPMGDDLLESLLNDGDNTTWYSAALALMTQPESTWVEQWQPLLEPYYATLELWLADYAEDPVVNQQSSGETVMTVRYEIPAQDVKAEIKALLQLALNDEALLTQLAELATEEQQFTYLTAGLMYYYEAAIDALPLEGEIVLERDLSTMGESVSTAISLPLPTTTGWRLLTMEQSTEGVNVTLSGDAWDISLEMENVSVSDQSAAYNGVLRLLPTAEEEQHIAVAFSLSQVSSHTVDDDTRAHDVTRWKMYLQADESVQDDPAYLTFEPITAEWMTHIHSKSGKRYATSLEVSFSFSQGTESLAVAGSIKTASPWVMDELPTEGAEDVTAMTENYLSEIAAQWWLNWQEALAAILPEALPEPAEATATDIATVTDMQAEPTSVPATTVDLTP